MQAIQEDEQLSQWDKEVLMFAQVRNAYYKHTAKICKEMVPNMLQTRKFTSSLSTPGPLINYREVGVTKQPKHHNLWCKTEFQLTGVGEQGLNDAI